MYYQFSGSNYHYQNQVNSLLPPVSRGSDPFLMFVENETTSSKFVCAEVNASRMNLEFGVNCCMEKNLAVRLLHQRRSCFLMSLSTPRPFKMPFRYSFSQKSFLDGCMDFSKGQEICRS